MAVLLKYCRICSSTEDGVVPPRTFLVNHIGSSGSMEATALVNMFHALADNQKCLLVPIDTDDDSKMKAALRWDNKGYEQHHGQQPYIYGKGGNHRVRKDTGCIRYPLAEPTFLLDKVHSKKGFKGRVCHVFGGPVAGKCGMLEVDIIRITTNFAYMACQLSSVPKAEWIANGKDVVDHHFDDHML
jgi:hypothetical protein